MCRHWEQGTFGTDANALACCRVEAERQPEYRRADRQAGQAAEERRHRDGHRRDLERPAISAARTKRSPTRATPSAPMMLIAAIQVSTTPNP